MVFSSLLFVFAFLAPQLALCLLVKDTKKQNLLLLCFSLIFYGFGGPKYLFLLAGEALVSWFTAVRIEKASTKQKKKLWLVLECLILFGLLVVFKYLTFLLSNTNQLFGLPEKVPEIILPIGISFYTFQLVSYVADVYRGEVKAQPRYWKVLLYASLFHQCIAGPIVRYQTVAAEIEERSVRISDVSAGIRRFSIGLAKKAILANGCAAIADSFLPAGIQALHTASTGGLWLGMLCYMLQIYLDFSAYSDMAIGMGRMIGFHYLENFNYPYTAYSVQGFWRRWHISLSTFFRDYVYIPLGGNRKGAARTIWNMFVVWALTGIWHGASWNYVLWGLYFFIFLVLERLFLGKWLEKSKATRFIGHLYTLLVVFFGWILFRFTDFSLLASVFKGLFGIGNLASTNLAAWSEVKSKIFFLLFSIVAVTPLGKTIRHTIHTSSLYHKSRIFVTGVSIAEALTPVVLLVLSVFALVGNSYNPFLYFQF